MLAHIIFLLIEFVDELVFGVTEAAWPLIRTDLGLNYIQIGLALSLPGIIASFIEPFLGILGDVWRRRLIILVGGAVFVFSLFLTAVSHSFLPLLLSFIVFNPASGAFVSLSQASLMDLEPQRHEQNMARWTFAGSLGVVLGPLLLSGLVFIGAGWRYAFVSLGLSAGLLLFFAWRNIPLDDIDRQMPDTNLVMTGLRQAFLSLRKPLVVRWLILLEFSDLMLDVLFGYLALYFVDVAGFSVNNAALAVSVWSVVGLAGDFLLIPFLEKVKGLDYLRWSVLLELVLFPAFLMAPQVWLKLTLVGLMGFFNAGWYAILKAGLYSTLPGQSGTVMALDNVSGFFGKFLPLGIGFFAQIYGLKSAMWLLLAGPLVLFFFLPRGNLEPVE